MARTIALALCLVAISGGAVAQEVIMRRPIPTQDGGTGGNGTPVDPGDQTDPGDVIILLPGGGGGGPGGPGGPGDPGPGEAEAVFLAYGTCVLGTLSNVVCGSYEVDGLIAPGGPANLDQCAAQSTSTLAYQQVATLGSRPNNTAVISPQDVLMAEGSPCSAEPQGAEVKTFVGIECGGGLLGNPPSCRQYNYLDEGFIGSVDFFSITEVAVENCTRTADYAMQPGYSSSLL